MKTSTSIVSSFDAKSTLNAIDFSSNFSSLCVGGREILQVLHFSDDSDEKIRFEYRLRRPSSTANTSCITNDVKWHPLPSHKQYIASTPTNGSIEIWNLLSIGSSKPERVFHEHKRPVNRVSWHHSTPSLLLSACQDGTVKLWDTRLDNSVTTFSAKLKLGGVRDVQFSPFDVATFAAALEKNGMILIWDIRVNNKWERQLTGHNELVLCLDWHPSTRKILATGGRDRYIKIWDLNEEIDRPFRSIATTSSVSKVKWRPQRPRQIASAASIMDSKIHIWDILQPFVPVSSCIGHQDVATGLVWTRDGTDLVSCSKDGRILKHRVALAYHPRQHIRNVGITFNASGSMATVIGHYDRNEDDDNDSLQFADLHSSLLSNVVSDPDRDLIRIFSGISSRNINSFVFLALNYRLKGDTISELCAHNSSVAESIHCLELAQIWTIIGFLFKDLKKHTCRTDEQAVAASSDSPASHNAARDTDALKQLSSALSHMELRSDLLFGTTLDVPDVVVAGRNSPSLMFDYTPAPEGENITTSLLKFLPELTMLQQKCFSQEIFMESCISEMLDHFGESGDVQTCVAVLAIIKESVKVTISSTRQQQWFLSYIDLLLRMKMWPQAADITNISPHTLIREKNMMNTTVHISCPKCHNPMDSAGDFCQNCKNSVIKCSICHEAVRGTYSWCQGCGHGGHADHMQEWFNSNYLCPTGCLHSCTQHE